MAKIRINKLALELNIQNEQIIDALHLKKLFQLPQITYPLEELLAIAGIDEEAARSILDQAKQRIGDMG